MTEFSRIFFIAELTGRAYTLPRKIRASFLQAHQQMVIFTTEIGLYDPQLIRETSQQPSGENFCNSRDQNMQTLNLCIWPKIIGSRQISQKMPGLSLKKNKLGLGLILKKISEIISIVVHNLKFASDKFETITKLYTQQPAIFTLCKQSGRLRASIV